MGAGSQIWVLCKNSKSSELWSRLPSASIVQLLTLKCCFLSVVSHVTRTLAKIGRDKVRHTVHPYLLTMQSHKQTLLIHWCPCSHGVHSVKPITNSSMFEQKKHLILLVCQTVLYTVAVAPPCHRSTDCLRSSLMLPTIMRELGCIALGWDMIQI